MMASGRNSRVPVRVQKLTVMIPSWHSSRGDMCSTPLQSCKSGRTSGHCRALRGAACLCPSGQRGDNETISSPLRCHHPTLRALMGWLLWEPKAADPIPWSMRLPAADGYSSWFPAGPDRPCTGHCLQSPHRRGRNPTHEDEGFDGMVDLWNGRQAWQDPGHCKGTRGSQLSVELTRPRSKGQCHRRVSSCICTHRA